MSNLSLDFSDNTFQPLAARMRPENLAQYIGQQHLLAAGEAAAARYRSRAFAFDDPLGATGYRQNNPR